MCKEKWVQTCKTMLLLLWKIPFKKKYCEHYSWRNMLHLLNLLSAFKMKDFFVRSTWERTIVFGNENFFPKYAENMRKRVFTDCIYFYFLLNFRLFLVDSSCSFAFTAICHIWFAQLIFRFDICFCSFGIFLFHLSDWFYLFIYVYFARIIMH